MLRNILRNNNKFIKKKISFTYKTFYGNRNINNNIYTELKKDYVNPKNFINELKKHNIKFFTGIPDSLLKNFTNNIDNNFITANEGSAIALASGYNLSTGNIPCVYLQNSGLGNIINPLLSLTNKNVYNIPMLIIIGWRGEPYKKDEPQHLVQGKYTENILKSCNIRYEILSDNIELAKLQLDDKISYIKETNNSFVFLVKKDTFNNIEKNNIEKKKVIDCYNIEKNNIGKNNIEKNNIEKNSIGKNNIVKNKYIQTLLDNNNIDERKYKIVSTTGFTSRELYELSKDTNFKNFYTVGSMGQCSNIALGIAINKLDKNIICLDGDGSLIMHMGNLVTCGELEPKNYIHIMFNNKLHESVGNHKTHNKDINFANIAKECGYKNTYNINTIDKFNDILDNLENIEKPMFIQVDISSGTIDNLPRPDKTLEVIKEEFIKSL